VRHLHMRELVHAFPRNPLEFLRTRVSKIRPFAPEPGYEALQLHRTSLVGRVGRDVLGRHAQLGHSGGNLDPKREAHTVGDLNAVFIEQNCIVQDASVERDAVGAADIDRAPAGAGLGYQLQVHAGHELAGDPDVAAATAPNCDLLPPQHEPMCVGVTALNLQTGDSLDTVSAGMRDCRPCICRARRHGRWRGDMSDDHLLRQEIA